MESINGQNVAMTIQELTYELLAERMLSHFDSRRFVDWAVRLLECNCDTDNLRILAGLDNEPTLERERYFWKVVDELKIDTDKSEAELIGYYAKLIAKRVLAGNMEPINGLAAIMKDVVWASDYSPRYLRLYEMEEDLDYLKYTGTPLFRPGLSLENQSEFIKEEFRLFLEMEN